MNEDMEPQKLHYEKLARSIAARLRDAPVHPHIEARLRVARMAALKTRKKEDSFVVKPARAVALPYSGWMKWLGTVTAAMAMVSLQWLAESAMEQHNADVAKLEMQVLTDDLPPSAWADPGFIEFIRKQ